MPIDRLFHLDATEPRETVLRVSVHDSEREMEVAYETAVLGVLRQGFRCFHLRSMKGVRIELCTLLVHIEIGEESNFLGDRRELVQTMLEQQVIPDEYLYS